MIFAGTNDKGSGYVPTRYFNRSGEFDVSMGRRIWVDSLTPTTASGFNIDISSAGFSVVEFVDITPMRNTSAASDVPSVSLKSVTSSQVSVNLMQANSSLVSILGVNIIGLQFLQNYSNVKLYVRITGK